MWYLWLDYQGEVEMSNKEYYTVEVNGKVKIQTKDYKSAYETTIFQRILGNDPVLKLGNKILICKKK